MYQNGYVPPRNTSTDRKRRAAREDAPARAADAAPDITDRGISRQRSSSVDQRGSWQQPVNQPAASTPRQRTTQDAYGVSTGYASYQPQQARRGTEAENALRQAGYQQSGISAQSSYADQAYPQGKPYGRTAYPQGAAYGQPYPPQSYQQPSSRQPDYGAGGYQPPQPPKPPYQGGNGGYGQPPSGSGDGHPPKKGGHRVLLMLLGLILVAGLVVGGAWGLRHYQTQQFVQPYDSVFCQGVYVDGIALGGMTAEEGVNAVTAQAQQRNNSWSVRLTFQGQVVTELNASQLGMTVDVIDVMQKAWEQGHVGDVYARRAAMEALLVNHFEAYTAMPSGDTSVVDSILQDIKNGIYRAAQDATVEAFNPENSYPFTFVEEVQGRMLNTEPLKVKLYQMVSSMESGDVEIEPEYIEPSVTVDMLKQHLSQRASVYTPIDKHSTENRTNNIRRAFQSISGYVLPAGSKFSFNTVVGKRTEANGFYEAIEYAYGDTVMGIGGGVCQASTTVYQAAVEAGLEITDRSPHSDAVSYAAYGEDATVYWESNRKIDFAFKNNTDYPIYLVASVQSDPSNRKRFIARVTIYGESLDNVRYELDSATVKTLTAPAEPEYVKDKTAKYVTYTDQEYIARKAKDGYVVESYRVKYVNNEAVERTLLYTDTYEAKTERIYVGVTKREK